MDENHVTQSEIEHALGRERFGYMKPETFRRWLAAHDRVVAANAWDEGAEAFGNRSRMNTPHGEWPPANPYREEQK